MLSKKSHFEDRLNYLAGLVNNISLCIGSILSIILFVNIVFLNSTYQITIAQFAQGLFGMIILYLSVKKIIRLRFIDLVISKGNRKYVFLLPFITISILIIYRINLRELEGYIRRIQEGSLFEWMGFLFILFSSFLLFMASSNNIDKKQQIFLKIAAVFMFLWSMEEMSWGQMIFNWGTPELMNSINIQHETNIHNLKFIHDKSWMILLVIFSFYFTLSIIGYFLRSHGNIQRGSFSDILFPIGCTSSYFFFAAIIYLGVVLLKSGIYLPILHTREQEIGELYFSLGFFIHSTNTYLNYSRS